MIGKFPHKYTQVAKKNHFKADISCISLANNTLMDVTHLALTWVGWPNGEKLASTCVQFELDQSVQKSSQVNASVHKAWPNGVASRPKMSSKLAFTCVWPGLKANSNWRKNILEHFSKELEVGLL